MAYHPGSVQLACVSHNALPPKGPSITTHPNSILHQNGRTFATRQDEVDKIQRGIKSQTNQESGAMGTHCPAQGARVANTPSRGKYTHVANSLPKPALQQDPPPPCKGTHCACIPARKASHDRRRQCSLPTPPYPSIVRRVVPFFAPLSRTKGCRRSPCPSVEKVVLPSPVALRGPKKRCPQFRFRAFRKARQRDSVLSPNSPPIMNCAPFRP